MRAGLETPRRLGLSAAAVPAHGQITRRWQLSGRGGGCLPKLMVLRFAECGGHWDWISGLALRARGEPHHALAGLGAHVGDESAASSSGPSLAPRTPRLCGREVRLNIGGIPDLGQLHSSYENGGEFMERARSVVVLQPHEPEAACMPTSTYLHTYLPTSRYRIYGTYCTGYDDNVTYTSQSPTPHTALCLDQASAMSAALLLGCFSAPPVRQSLLPSHVSGVAASPTNDIPCPGPDDVLYSHLLPQNHGQVLGSRLPGEEARRVRVEPLVDYPLSIMLLFCLPQGSLRVVGVRACGDQ